MTLTFVNEQTGGGGRRRWRSDPGPGADRRRRGGGGGGGGFGGGLFSGSVAQRDAVAGSSHHARARRRSSSCRTRRRSSLASTIRAPATAASRFVDYSQPIAESIQFRYIRRHRLQKKDPNGGDQRTDQADSVLGRFGRARRREEGARRRRELVEPGVRSGRLPQRVQGRRAARGRRSDGHPLQHDQLGPSLDAWLELGWLGVGSAYRRDHQGDRHARIAARSPGLHDLRGPAVAVREWRRASRGPLRNRAGAHPPAVGARGRPHARPRPQLLRQQQGLGLGDGLSAPARSAERRRHDRSVEGVCRRRSAIGTRSRSTSAIASSRRARTRARS